MAFFLGLKKNALKENGKMERKMDKGFLIIKIGLSAENGETARKCAGLI